MNLIDLVLVYLTIFQEITGKREEHFEIQEGSTLMDLLENLCKKYGKKFRETLLDPKSGRVYGHNHVTLNGRLAHLLDKKFEMTLKDGDRVVIAHAVSGG